MRRLYSHPREYRKILLENYLCNGFCAGGYKNRQGKQTFKPLTSFLRVFTSLRVLELKIPLREKRNQT